MYVHRRLATAVAVILSALPWAASAVDSPVVGTWKLVEYSRVNLDTGQKVDLFGQHPSGYIMYLANGRMSAVIVGDGRAKAAGPVATEAERLKLYDTIIAGYTGTYSVEGDRVIHHVDVSWNQSWTGTDQLRYFKIDGNKLTINNPPRTIDTGQRVSSVLVFERVP